jgi:hypothetical protein
MRSRCKKLASESGKTKLPHTLHVLVCTKYSFQVSRFSPGSSSERRGSPQSFSDFADLYTHELLTLGFNMKSLVPTGSSYKMLVESRISEISNNASLMLRQMESLKQQLPDEATAAELIDVATDTIDACQVMREIARTVGPKLSTILRKGIKLLRASVTRSSRSYIMDLGEAADALLSLAISIEKHLGNLLDELEKDRVAKDDTELSALLGRMTMAAGPDLMQARPVKMVGRI